VKENNKSSLKEGTGTKNIAQFAFQFDWADIPSIISAKQKAAQ